MPENPEEFDLIVIGGGPAGIIGATTAAAFGKTVAVVDSHHELGGAGANTGTVPSKTLRETALALSGSPLAADRRSVGEVRMRGRFHQRQSMRGT